MQLRYLKHEGAPVIALTEEDRNTLSTVFGARLRIFIPTMLVLLFMLILTGGIIPPANFSSHDIPHLYHGRAISYEHSPFSRGETWLSVKLFLCLITFIPSWFIFRRRIWTYRQDLLQGQKLVLYERVAYKQYFPFTGQFFIALEDADYMHHEVDRETYESLKEGELYPVYFAPNSHYAFNPRGTFTAM